MADQPETPSTDPPLAPEPVEEFDAERAKAKIAKVNSEAKSLRDRLKELEPLAAKVKEQEDAAKSVEERAVERITAAERRAADAEARALRLEVAAEKGLTPNQARRLVGATREELEADAADLLASFPAAPAQEATPVNGRPKERLRPGAVAESLALNGDPLEQALRQKLGIT